MSARHAMAQPCATSTQLHSPASATQDTTIMVPISYAEPANIHV